MKNGWIQVTDPDTQAKEELAPKTLADNVYMDGTLSESVKDAIFNHEPIHFEVDLPANGWSATAPYTQTVLVPDLLVTDIPLGDVLLSDDPATATRQLQAYEVVNRMNTENGQLTAWCYDFKPEEDLTIRLKVVR
ncbi:MAG: hypothetical protein GXY67_07495 [Clostridiales bacterium]|nr:hypothetical protein [Clostridiales bacterium]